MPDKNNQKDKSPYIMREVDPAVEAKVDELMTGEAPRPVITPTVFKPDEKDMDSQSAPLLPGEKLPNFDKKEAPKADSPA